MFDEKWTFWNETANSNENWWKLNIHDHHLDLILLDVLTKSGVISRWIVISPTQSLQSPNLSNTMAQLAVGDVSEIQLELVAPAGNVPRRNSPFWSRPKADMSDTAPLSFWRPSAILRPTPPPENFVSDLYVAPFSCTWRNKQRISTMTFMLLKNSRFQRMKEEKRKIRKEKRKIYCHRACWGKVLWAATRLARGEGGGKLIVRLPFAVSISGRYKV